MARKNRKFFDKMRTKREGDEEKRNLIVHVTNLYLDSNTPIDRAADITEFLSTFENRSIPVHQIRQVFR